MGCGIYSVERRGAFFRLSKSLDRDTVARGASLLRLALGEALGVFGPRAFGLDVDWVPVEELATR